MLDALTWRGDPTFDGLAFAMAAPAALLVLLLLYGVAYRIAAEARAPRIGDFLEVPGGRLHVIARGEHGPLVLLLHGASANAREFAVVLDRAEGFRFAAIDRPGHGYSASRRRNFTLAAQAEAAAEAIEALGGGPAVVVAHSLGAATALRLALDRPDLVAGLVLVAPATHPYPGDPAWHARVASTPILGWLFCHTVVPLFGPMMARRAIANTFAPAEPPPDYFRKAGVGLLFRPAVFRRNAREMVATRQEFAGQYYRYDEIAAPTIILTADKDRVVSPRIHTQGLKRALPNVEVVTVPGTGHMPHAVRPDAVLAAIRRVLTLAGVEGAR